MIVERCQPADIEDWLALRCALWPEGSAAEHRAELEDILINGREVAFIARDASGTPLGFTEAALRHDYVNGCDTSPVAFLEGIYVTPAQRRCGVAQKLCAAVEDWARATGCSEFASDAALDNLDSHAMHRALGFAETERVVYFRKPLAPV